MHMTNLINFEKTGMTLAQTLKYISVFYPFLFILYHPKITAQWDKGTNFHKLFIQINQKMNSIIYWILLV